MNRRGKIFIVEFTAKHEAHVFCPESPWKYDQCSKIHRNRRGYTISFVYNNYFFILHYVGCLQRHFSFFPVCLNPCPTTMVDIRIVLNCARARRPCFERTKAKNPKGLQVTREFLKIKIIKRLDFCLLRSGSRICGYDKMSKRFKKPTTFRRFFPIIFNFLVSTPHPRPRLPV